jgi:putative membrane protein
MSEPATSDPLAEPTPDGTVPTVEWRRLNPKMLLIHPVTEVGKALPALLVVVFAGSSSGHSYWGLIGFAIVLAASILRWFTTRFRITAERIELRHGLFRRTLMTAPLDRVRTVDVTEHALHRALGLARVVIGTGTSDRKREGMRLDGLTTQEARVLRAELLHRSPDATPAVAAGPSIGTGSWAPMPAAPSDEQVLSRFNVAWVRYAPFTMSGVITALAIIGFLWRVVNETRANLRDLTEENPAVRQLRDQPVWRAAVVIAILILLFVAILSTLGYVLAFWNFTLTRHRGGSLQVRRGLITSRTTSIEERRLAGAEVSEPLVLRLVGGARLLAIATGLRVGRGAERGGTVLLPPAPRREVDRVAAAVAAPGSWTIPLVPHGPRAARRRYVRAVAASTAVVAIVGAIWWLADIHNDDWLYAAVLIPVMLPIAGDRARALGHARVDGYLITRSGSLVRRRCALQGEAVIGWNLRSSFFARRAGLATLVATTAAGRQGYRVVDVEAGTAVALAEQVAPGLLTEFLIS